MCYDDPHPPYFVPRPYDTMIDPKDLPLPPKGDEGKLPAWQANAREEAGSTQATDSDVRKVLATYYGMIRYIDDEMEKLYSSLDQGGHLDNTWIVIGSDHGDYTGEKDLFNKSESLYKCLLHVPLIIVPPHGTNVQPTTPARIEHLVSSVDLFPTLLGLAGIMPPINQGVDLLPWVRDGAGTAIHDAVFAQVGDYHGHIGTSWPSGMPASGRHKSLTYSARSLMHSYIRDPDNGDEAYDLITDPFELENLLHEGLPPLTAQHAELLQHIDAFEQSCTQMREELGVVAGDRGFVKGWE
jgi:arylsulfatase A-like enzyme